MFFIFHLQIIINEQIALKQIKFIHSFAFSSSGSKNEEEGSSTNLE